MIVDKTTVHITPAYEAGPYEIHIGFFGGWAPSWKNLAISEAPEPRDPHHRFKLASVIIER